MAAGAILLTFVAPLAVQAGKKMLGIGTDALVKEFSQTAEFAVKRVFQRILPKWQQDQPVFNLEVRVTPPPKDEGEQVVVSPV